MSRFVMEISGQFIEEIDSMDVCKHMINGICSNEDCVCLGYCMETACNSNKDCEYFEEEDGIIGDD